MPSTRVPSKMITPAGGTATREVTSEPASTARPSVREHNHKARMLLIVNPKATTVSSRLKNLVVYALRGRYEVEAVETESQNHAISLTREAAREAYDLVVAFGGDGTVNEAANGLVGSDVPLSVLPGGCTNVVCRMLGIPTDVVDATEHLLGLADGLEPRRVDLGKVNDRYFVASSGIGLDADTARWADEHAPLKSRAGPLFFSYAALMSFYGKYVGRPPRIAVEAHGERTEGVTAVVQNSDPFTYFNSRPVKVCRGAALDNGVLSMTVLMRARQRDLPGLGWKLLTGRGSVSEHPEVRSYEQLSHATVSSLDPHGRQATFPVQVDGDYIGECAEATFEVRPASLLMVA
jgi:diacylglycerol kinase family enzyme